MAEMRASPVKSKTLKRLADIVRMAENQGQMEFLPFNPMTLFPVSSTTLENLAYGNLPMAIPSQSNIPITKTGRKQEVAELAGLLPMVPATSRGVTQGANYLGDVMTQAVTRNPQATSMRALSEISQMSPFPQITTYHGSPHLFGRLDPSKVGTGEGAQAYGVGAGYISEGRPVAESYRASVAAQKQRAGENMGEVTIGGKPIDWGKPEEVAAFELARHAGDRKAAADFHARTFLGGEENPAVKLLRSDKELPKADMPGYLYKGDLPDEILPKFLDWDQPISNQKELRQILENENLQDLLTRNEPKKVGRFTQVRMGGEPSGAEITGADLYRNLAEKLGSEKKASDYLEKIGIRGIRYLDQGSRGSGEGTSNFIPFNPKDFRIEEINDQPIADWVRSGRLQVDPNDPLAQFLQGK
jgi:hypothetical protein